MSGVARPIKWIGKRSYGGRFVIGRKDILPICIRAGASDDNVPQRDLWISPHHAMYLDGTLIEAKDLVNGVSIVQAERVEKVEYFHIELETPRCDHRRGRVVRELHRRRQSRNVPQRARIPHDVSA